ncbi:TrmH family RNA methyltransferase [[Mycoplasma] collis]|uniref:TrmH family RNA methyltransferase n=1 Tax=[Mycoplasma] collis TaxID=2127 RepID=UPI00051C9D35|nr:RNA methyltransferase [[Mycoplasma] collis]
MINSIKNNKIIELSKLKIKKYRDLTNTFLIEGQKIINEALNENLILKIYTSDLNYKNNFVEVIYVSQNIINKLSSLHSKDNKYIALCKKKNFSFGKMKKIVILDNIQDPGNLGAIIRNSIAFNFDSLIVEGVDIYNEKVIRSSKGALFKLNIINVNNLAEFLKQIKENFLILGTDLTKKAIEIQNFKLEKSKNVAIIFGNEGHGISPQISQYIDQNIYIKINFESLNIAIANGIILYFLKD